MTHDPFAAVPNGARHAALAEMAQAGTLHHLVLPTTVPAWVITGHAEDAPRSRTRGWSRAGHATRRTLTNSSRRRPPTAEADLVSAVAYPLPMTVICDLLGIPPSARTNVRDWIGPLLTGGVGTFEAYAGAARRMLAFLRELIAEKRREPADDLLTALIEARDGDDRLTQGTADRVYVSRLQRVVADGHQVVAPVGFARGG